MFANSWSLCSCYHVYFPLITTSKEFLRYLFGVSYHVSCQITTFSRLLLIHVELRIIWYYSSVRKIHKKLKLEMLKTCVFSGMLYGCEAWTITKVAEAKILAFERKCYRKILRIGWMQKVTNAELYRRIDLTENLMQKIITRKLELF